MVFGGIQKLTLLDYPDKAACTLFAVGCNFNCTFCHNSSHIELTEGMQTISTDEVFEFLRSRQGLLDAVCISGGEPLMQNELGDFVHEVKSMGYLVKIDTNGSYPHRLKELVKSGAVDFIAMDIKNSPEKYAQTVCVSNYDISQVEKSKNFLLSGAIPYEFRTTIVRELHSVFDLLSIAKWIAGADRYYLQRFQASGDVRQSGLSGYNDLEMRQLMQEIEVVLPTVELRGV